MKKILFFILMGCVAVLKSNAQVVQPVIHTREIATYSLNYGYKNGRDALIKNTIENIKKTKESVEQLRLKIVTIHQTINTALTTVNSAVKEAKSLKFTYEHIKCIENDFAILTNIARHTIRESTVTLVLTHNGHETTSEQVVYVMFIAHITDEYIKIIKKRIENLEAYIVNFVLSQKGAGIFNVSSIFTGESPNIISNVVRERFLTNIYKEVYMIDVTLHSFIYKAQNVHVQEVIRNMNPLNGFVNRDKQIMNNITNNISNLIN